MYGFYFGKRGGINYVLFKGVAAGVAYIYNYNVVGNIGVFKMYVITGEGIWN